MQIPTGNWIVVRKHSRDYVSPGEVLYSNLHEEVAKRRALFLNDGDDWVNHWAINLDDADCQQFKL